MDRMERMVREGRDGTEKKEKQMESRREGQRETASILYHVNKNQAFDQMFQTYFIQKVNLGFQASPQKPVELFNAASWRAPLSKAPFASTLLVIKEMQTKPQ